MIVLLDPLLFEVDAGLDVRLDEVARICAEVAARIPKDTNYWKQFSRSIIEPARRAASGRVRRACDRLLAYAVPVHLALPSPPPTAITGAGTLIGQTWSTWQAVVDDVLARCTTSTDDVAWIVRLVEGRNLHMHAGRDTELREKNPWQVTVATGSFGALDVPCLHALRNVSVRWTTRYDERLPAAAQDGARFPFCPDPNWSSPETNVRGTRRSRPAWFDVRGNGWSFETRSKHWDVVLVQALEDVVGLDQINVTPFGYPGVKAGELDHVPQKKRHALRDDSGWRCE